jgi:O-6-methylguanine DNA methyltransferase
MTTSPIRDGVFEIGIRTPEGEFLAKYSAAGLCGLEFPSRVNDSKLDATKSQLPPEIRAWHQTTDKALQDALAGRKPRDLPPLDLSSGTAFQQIVWNTLQKIGFGETWSYGEVAEAIGKPKAVRAVGGACGANPIPVFVPCHRVLAANHKLGGFSGGLDWKVKLLNRERVTFKLPGLVPRRG